MRSLALLILLIGTSVSSTLIVSGSPHADIDVGSAYNMITGGAYPDLVVLDVRSKGEYDSGHIYGATLIPVAVLQQRIGELASHTNDEIIVYCQSGGRSATASDILDSNGFTKVYNMLGGLSAWKSAGYPTWNATVHNVDTTYNYDTIQAAIDSSITVNGNTILVDRGPYHEHVVVSKTLSIAGQDPLDTIIDGNGTGTVVSITADNVVFENFTIQSGNEFGVYLNGGNCAQIRNNKIMYNYCGVNVSSSYNVILGNEIANNQYCGVSITRGNSTILENNIMSNNYGLCISSSQASDGNLICHNRFLSNTYQASTVGPSGPWDDGYPSGGNCWSDYNGTDLSNGVYQNLTGRDGVGDTPYAIDANNTDHYPLTHAWLPGPYSLIIISTEGGTTSPAPGTYVYNATSYVQVAAMTYENYTFDHWELDGYNVTGTNETSIRTDADHTLKAVFTRSVFTLRITFTDGGSTDPTTGSHIFYPDTEAFVSALPDPGCYLDRWELDDIYVGIFSPMRVVMDKDHTLHAVFRQLDIGHNIAAKWIASKTVVGQGLNLSINVTVMNIGGYAEEFNVTAHLNSTSMTLENVTVESGAFTTITFTMNTSGFPKGNNTLWAHAWPVLGEIETEDNNCTGEYVIVSIVGDLTGGTPNSWDFVPDGKVSGVDVSVVARCFGSWPEATPPMRWEPNCDLNNNGHVDGTDVATVARHFGEADP